MAGGRGGGAATARKRKHSGAPRVSFAAGTAAEKSSPRAAPSRNLLVRAHPHGVKPLGNMYFSNAPYDSRRSGLGSLQCLQDEVILEILRSMDETVMCSLSLASKALYVFVQTDELWKSLYVDWWEEAGCKSVLFKGTWKETLIAAKYNRKGELPSAHPIKIEGFFSDALFNRWQCATVDVSRWEQGDNIDRRSNLSMEDFLNEYGTPNKPVIITDIVPKWPAFKLWTKEYLLKQFGEVLFKTDHGVTFTLEDYMKYSESISEAQPMYLFDNEFGEKAPLMLQQYEVPQYFKEDFFSVLEGGTHHRPSFRWLLVGPPKTGSSFHKDPNATSAWNGLLYGLKKWIFFPPDKAPPGVFPSEDELEVVTPESVVEWFIDFYPQTKKKNAAFKPIECLQRPGDLVFVPSGWWHAALNLEESVAVTQNVVSSQNLARVLDFLPKKEKQDLFEKFTTAMRETYPAALEKAENMLKESEWDASKKQKTHAPSAWEKVLQPQNGEDGNTFKFSLF